MTDTAAREEAVERVRAYVEAMEPGHDDHSIDGVLSYDGEKLDQLLLGDLRLLLTDPRQPSEAPVTADEGWRPSKEAIEKIIADHIDFPLGWGAGIADPLTLKSCAVTRDDIGRAAAEIAALPAPPTGEGGGL